MALSPTPAAIKTRHKIAFREVGKGRSLHDAMITAGYSETTAGNTVKMTKTKSWQALMEKFLPDSKLAKVHEEGLNATQFIPQGIGKGETTLVEVPDHSVRHKYLKTAYDLKGRIRQTETASGTTSNTLIVITAPQETQLSPPTAIEHQEITP